MTATPRHQQLYSSHFETKVVLRRQALLDLPDPLRVLDAYHGQGEVWTEVARRLDRPVEVVGIDKAPGEDSPAVLHGDNRKVLRAIDLDRYSLIDLDAYGMPTEQLRIVADRAPHVPVMATVIQHTIGPLPRTIMRDLGIPAMPDKRTGVYVPIRWDIWWWWWVAQLGYTHRSGVRFAEGMTKWYGLITRPAPPRPAD